MRYDKVIMQELLVIVKILRNKINFYLSLSNEGELSVQDDNGSIH